MTTRIQQFPFGVGGAGGLNDVVDDLTPQYGGNMDMNGFNLVATDAAGPEILDLASSGSVATVKPNRGTVAGLGGSGGVVDIITGAGLSGLRVGTGPGNVNTVVQPLGTSGLFIGSVSGSFGLHNLASSATVPTVLTNFLSEGTGIGGTLGTVSVITGSLERLRIDASGDVLIKTAGRVIGGDNANGGVIRNLAASATVATLAPDRSNPTSGVGLAGPGELSLITDGIESLRIDSAGDTFLRQSGSSFKGSVIGGPAIFNRAASATVPTVVVHRGATTSGWGAQASGNLSAIISAVEVGRFDGSVTADDMRLFLFDASAGALKRVTRGAVDSGGTGTRLLRVAN